MPSMPRGSPGVLRGRRRSRDRSPRGAIVVASLGPYCTVQRAGRRLISHRVEVPLARCSSTVLTTFSEILTIFADLCVLDK